MKRLEVAPTPGAIEQSIESNASGRNEDIVEFVKLLNRVQGPYAIMLDAPWGEGKTFFIRSVDYVLKVLNQNIKTDEADPLKLEPVLSRFDEIEAPFLPFYFNAWDNDYADDPIVALLANMAVSFDRMEYAKDVPFSNCIATVLDSALAVASVTVNAKEMVNALKGESLIQAYEKKVKLRDRINELAESCICEVANKLVIVIDELDRCRPDFAVRLLEQSKSLFQSDNIITIIVTDSVQLSKAVAGMYGAGFDSAHFLERFYDYKLSLAPIDGYALAYGQPYRLSSVFFDQLVREVLVDKPLTTRDAMRLEKIGLARAYVERTRDNGYATAIGKSIVLPLLIFIERDDPVLFRDIVKGCNPDGVYEYGKKYDTLAEMADRAISATGRLSSAEGGEGITEEQRRDYYHDLCVCIFSTDRYGKQFEEASGRFGGYIPEGLFDLRVYKSLQFPTE